MALKKVDKPEKVDYPSYDDFQKNRRKFITGLAAGVATTVVAGSAAAWPWKKNDNDEALMGDMVVAEPPERLSGEVAEPVEPPKPVETPPKLGGKPMPPEPLGGEAMPPEPPENVQGGLAEPVMPETSQHRQTPEITRGQVPPPEMLPGSPPVPDNMQGQDKAIPPCDLEKEKQDVPAKLGGRMRIQEPAKPEILGGIAPPPREP